MSVCLEILEVDGWVSCDKFVEFGDCEKLQMFWINKAAKSLFRGIDRTLSFFNEFVIDVSLDIILLVFISHRLILSSGSMRLSVYLLPNVSVS